MTTRKTAYPDASTAIAISTQMVEAIKAFEDAIPGLGERVKSRDVAAEILPLIDTAQIIGLRVVALSMRAAHDLAKALQEGKVTEQGGSEALAQGLATISDYLNTVAGGKINSGFSLHAPTAEMQRFVGQEAALRQEFFLPVAPVFGPNSPTYNEGSFIAEVARYSDDFRQEMKRYETKKEFSTVNEMRKALVTIETKNPPSNFRMLLSLSIIFMDVAIRSGGKIARENEPLIARIDRELAGVVNGELDADEGTISWLMYVVGQSNQFSARIRAFQEAYELTRLVEESQSSAINNQALVAVRNAMDNAQRAWEVACVTGGDMGAAKAACFALAAVTNTLGDYAMKTMAVAMGSLADAIVDGRLKIDHEVAVFGASVLVAMNDRLERVSVEPAGGRAAAERQRDRVRLVVSGKRPSELVSEVSSQGGHVQVILGELNNDLGSAEQIIDQALRDGAKDAKREEIARLFSTVQDALSFVNMPEAVEYASLVAGHVDKVFVKLLAGESLEDQDKSILAESVMMLHRYVNIVTLDAGQAAQALVRGNALFATIEQVVEAAAAKEEGPFDVCSDEDLGPIFFEEAKQVIDELIKPGLEKLRVNIADESTMLDVRRGFHTLKGSSRMVELNNLGMVGQHAEYVLNIFRDNRNIKPNSELLNWLDHTATYFYQAVLVLEHGKPAQVNPAPFEAVYNQFRDTNVFKGPESLTVESGASSAVEEQAAADAVGVEGVDSPAANDLAVHIPETGAVIMPVGEVVEPVAEPVLEVKQAVVIQEPNLVSEELPGEIAMVGEPVAVEIAIVDQPMVAPESAPPVIEFVVDSVPPVATEDHLPPVVEPVLAQQEQVVEPAEPVAEVPTLPVLVDELEVAEVQAAVEEPALPELAVDAVPELVAELTASELPGSAEVPELPMLTAEVDEASLPVIDFVPELPAAAATEEVVGAAEEVPVLPELPALPDETLAEPVAELALPAIELVGEAPIELVEEQSAVATETPALPTIEAQEAPELALIAEPGAELPAAEGALAAEAVELIAAIEETVTLVRDDQSEAHVAVVEADHMAVDATAPPLPDIPPIDAIAESIPLSVVEPLPEDLARSQTVSETTPDSSGEVMVGEVSIPTILFAAFVTEASSFVESLQTAINDVVTGKRDNVDFEIMRMAHSIAGMGRTTGLTAVTHLAGTVETWVAINQDRQLNITDEVRTTLLDAMESLDAMIMGVREHVEPAIEDKLVARLEQIIAADERRIAMAEDIRPDVSQSQLDELDRGDVAVSDEGVVETVQRIQEPADAAAIDNTAAVTEVAKAPEPFRFFDQAQQVEAGQEAGHAQQDLELDQGLRGRDLVTSSEGSLHGDVYQEQVSDQAFAAIPDIVSEDQTEPIAVSEIVEIPVSVQQTIGSVVLRALPPQTTGSAVRDQEVGSMDWLAIVSAKDDDVDPEMFDIFGEEADERFREIDEAIGALQENVTDKKTTNLLKRAVHTLKGSANTAGCRKIGVIFHHLEDLMEEVGTLNAQTLAVLQSGVDAAFAGLAAMRRGRSVESAIKKVAAAFARPADGAKATENVAEISESSISESSISESSARVSTDGDEERQSTTSVLGGAQRAGNAQSIPGTTTVKTSSAPTATTSSANKPQAQTRRPSKAEEEEGNLRVSGRQLDKMVKAVGEINITRSRVGMNVGITKMALTGLAVSLERMYGYLRQVELEAERQMSAGAQNAVNRDSAFDALQMDRFTRLQELTRRVAEAQNDVMTQQGAAVGAVRDMEDALAGQYVLVSELSEDLDQIRQVRVSSIVPQLKRVVRAACRDTGKLSEIYFDADVEIDRGILSKVMGSLEHILRNAVAHGIESPEGREAAGKEATGTIEFRAYQDGGEVVIEIRDDGSGMDPKKIYDSAMRKGVIKPGAQLSESQIRELIFEPGFSTASEVTDIAGRGVGLDVVRSDISAMGGRVLVDSVVGTGTVFVLRVPATLTVIAGAAVSTNGHMYVIPVSFIDRLVRVSGEELETAYRSRKLIIQEAESKKVEYEFWGMWEIGGAKVWENSPQQRNSIILMRNDRVAVHVDDIRPAGEFVFRPLGPQITATSGLIGSTISSNGNAALVVDPSRVARSLRLAVGSAQARMPEQKKSPLVLVVDDSTTVRKVTARLLKKEGFRHAEAENGMKALEMLQQEMPAVILMDIEMPVMNGYEASQAIRATPDTAHIPIIMITSRVGESHRQRAMDLGVNEYLGKPYNESDLVQLIRKYTEEQPLAAQA